MGLNMFLSSMVALAMVATVAPGADAVGIATASIDLGNEWIKIGLVKPGVPMDIVLNQESKRKTPVVISLRDNERAFSSPAEVVAVKYPKYAFSFLTELLGMQVDSQTVKDYKKRFPWHTIEADPNRGTVMFRLDNVTYTVEELLAQIVNHAVSNAAEFAEQEISSIVITVPPYFNQAQRRALKEVGRIANLKILQLLNANMGVAINYGVFRQSSFNETEQNIMFYDMGSTSTIATIVGYSTVKEKGQTKPTAQAEIKGVGYDRSLGGLQWDLRLADHLMNIFKENPKLKGVDPSTEPRAVAKLFKATQKVKTVLSANKETKAQVEGLYKEIDFKTVVTRDEFENMTQDLFERVAGPINAALADAKMTAADLDQIILFGGGVRIPKIQEILKETVGVETLGKSINGDEAACLGASYQAAVLSKGYRVKKFITKDYNAFPIQVNFDREQTDNETNVTSVRRIKNTIFPRGNPYPQKKVLTFRNFKDDFNFDINYGNVSEIDLQWFSTYNISSYNLTSVKAAFEGHENDDEKGIKVHFRLDDSGIVTIDKAEAIFEREPPPDPDSKSTLEKLSGWFFGSDDNETNATKPGAGNETEDSEKVPASDESKEEADSKKDDSEGKKEESDDKVDEKEESEPKTDNEGKSDESTEKEEPNNDKEDNKENDNEDDNSEESNGNSTGANETESETGKTDGATNISSTTNSSSNATIETNATAKKLVIKVPLITTSETLDLNGFDEEGFAAAQGRIQLLIDLENDRKAREAALNTLEGMVYTNKDFLYSEEAEAVTNETQREIMMENLTATSEWLDEDGWNANVSALTKKIKQVNETVKSMYYRAAEAESRPVALAKLNESLNSSSALVAYLRLNISERIEKNETLWHTEKEVDDLQNLVNETSTWLAAKLTAHANLSSWQNPGITTRHINEKTAKLDREYYYLIKKPKPRPKKKPKAPKNLTDTNSTIELNVTNGTNATDAPMDGTEDNATIVEETTETAPDTADSTVESETKSENTEGGDTAGTEKDADDSKKETKGDEKTNKKDKKAKKDKASKSKTKKDKKDKRAKKDKKTTKDETDL